MGSITHKAATRAWSGKVSIITREGMVRADSVSTLANLMNPVLITRSETISRSVDPIISRGTRFIICHCGFSEAMQNIIPASRIRAKRRTRRRSLELVIEAGGSVKLWNTLKKRFTIKLFFIAGNIIFIYHIDLRHSKTGLFSYYLHLVAL
jgi:hypothetical protein